MSAARFERELKLHERVAAAAGAGTIASVLVNPLDVVKTRMQAQATTKPSAPASAGEAVVTSASIETRNWVLANGHYTWPTRSAFESPEYFSKPPATPYRSTLDGLLKIVRNEGVRVLYRGMDINLLVGVPMVASERILILKPFFCKLLICMYLPAYDNLSLFFTKQGLGNFSPLFAGSAARAAAVLATSPVELIKTRLQNCTIPPGKGKGQRIAKYMSIWQSLDLNNQPTVTGKVRTLWTGVGATLLKDVPFAGLYWTLLEPFKRSLQKMDSSSVPSHSRTLLVDSSAGAAAGGLAAAATIPFDVIKTHTQTMHQHSPDKPSMGVFSAMLDIGRKRGWTALFAGWAPRSIRTAVAYAILMGSYEQCKLYCIQPAPIYPQTFQQ